MLQVQLIHLSLFHVISVNIKANLYKRHTFITWSSHCNLPWKYGCINMFGDCWCMCSASGEWTIDPNPPPSLCKVNTSPHPLCTTSTAPRAAWRVQQVISQNLKPWVYWKGGEERPRCFGRLRLKESLPWYVLNLGELTSRSVPLFLVRIVCLQLRPETAVLSLSVLDRNRKLTFLPNKERPTLKSNSSRIGACQAQNSFTLAHQTLYWKWRSRKCETLAWALTCILFLVKVNFVGQHVQLMGSMALVDLG